MTYDPNNKELPFLTRDMLAFENGTAFGLRVQVQSSAVFTIRIVGATKEGPFVYNFITSGDSERETTNFAIPDIPIFLTLRTDTNGVDQGELYVSATLTINGTAVYELCTGFITQQRSISYPRTHNESPISYKGILRRLTGSNAAAGSEASITLPDARTALIRALHVRLVTDATAASRRVHFLFSDFTAGVIGECFASIDQTASQTMDYRVAPYGAIPDEQDNGVILVNLPPNIILTGGSTIDTVTLNIQAGDNFAAMSADIEEFFEIT